MESFNHNKEVNMSDNQANPVEGAETDLQNAAKSIEGLLNQYRIDQVMS